MWRPALIGAVAASGAARRDVPLRSLPASIRPGRDRTAWRAGAPLRGGSFSFHRPLLGTALAPGSRRTATFRAPALRRCSPEQCNAWLYPAASAHGCPQEPRRSACRPRMLTGICSGRGGHFPREDSLGYRPAGRFPQRAHANSLTYVSDTDRTTSALARVVTRTS